jgi:hypothetical protein
MVRSKAAPSRLDPCRTKVCASRSCVATAGGVNPVSRGRIFEVHHKEFRSHSGADSQVNLITLCTACHARLYRRQGALFS